MCAVNGIAMIWGIRSLLPSRLDVVVCRLPCVGRQHAVCVGQVCRRAGWAGPQRRAVSNRKLQRIFTVSTHTPRPIPKRGKFHPCFPTGALRPRRGRFASRYSRPTGRRPRRPSSRCSRRCQRRMWRPSSGCHQSWTRNAICVTDAAWRSELRRFRNLLVVLL